jgi:hypothetical protein
MPDPDENYTVEEVELSEFETGFIAGVLAAWGVKGQPTENQLRDALALMMAEASDLDGGSG